MRLYMRIQCGIHGTELAEEAYEVDEDLLDYEMPSIILQPLVGKRRGARHRRRGL